MNAQPVPIVSGSHFFPVAPLLCTKLIPACLVMSLKVTCAAAGAASAAHSDIAMNDFRMTFMALLLAPCNRGMFFGDLVRSLALGFRWCQRRRSMLVNQLALVVIFRMEPPVRPGDDLGRLVGLEAHIELLVLRSFRAVPDTLVSQHQIVVCLQVFR